ncbi:hypothetical protein IMZ31_16825 [Pontibacillus sp. ALD_SL1]|uniref:GAP1-N2 domain-containing protein n=1 Tax=Pontibacillus sp. ALD_SL1 TaxID=2777185 RepID=UPI001A966A6A|nr:hypothetical protein [Pontibacillus sp. ALD_SL1]QSS99706.1 hypothetical protein IMZ31_16825 [Pontibacillus sp. ALD_SL1]
MKIEQLYYTSAKRGIGNGSGFQAYNMSEGISSSEVSEIKNLVGYVPPSTLPSQPTPEEIEGQFPKSFTFFKLSTGRYGVFQSTYVGKDYSERYGNYFSHVLVFDGASLPDYPMAYYQSPIFKEKLTTDEEHSEQTPETLPTLQDLPKNPDLSFSRVAQFLKEGDRMTHFRAMISSLVTNPEARKRFMIMDEPETLPFWFAAIHYALPLKLAHHVTLTTYTHNPDKNPALLNSTWESGTRFSTGPASQHPYYLFDFENSNVLLMDNDAPYATYVADNIRRGKSLHALFELLNQSGVTTLDSRLNAAVPVLRLMERGISDLQKDELVQAMDFVREHGDEQLFAQVLDKLSQYWFNEDHLKSDVLELSLNQAHSIALFLLEGAQKTKQSEHMYAVYAFVLTTLDQALVDAHKPDDIQKARHYYQDINSRLGRSTSFSEAIVLHDRISELINYLKTEPNESKIAFYLNQILDHLLVLRRDWESMELPQKQMVYMLFLLSSKNQSTNKVAVLQKMYALPSLFVHTVSKYYTDCIHNNTAYKKEIEHAFHEFLLILHKDVQASVRPIEILAREENGKPLILNGIYHNLEASNHPVQLLEDSYKNLFTRIQVLNNDYKKLVNHVLKQVLHSTSPQEQLVQFFMSRYDTKVGEKELRNAIEVYDNSLRFTGINEKQEKVATLVKQINYDRQLKANLITIRLISATSAISEKGVIEAHALDESFIKILNDLSVERYKSYLDWSLPLYFEREMTEANRFGVLEKVCIPERIDIFFESLSGHIKLSKNAKMATIHTFLLHYFSKRRVESREELYQKLDQDLIGFFQQNKSEFRKANEYILKHPKYKKSETFQSKWGVIQSGASEKKRSLLSKIKNRFK